jgi:prepilin signal peptidase PulO-like enzyme (type II secretory pathway)
MPTFLPRRSDGRTWPFLAWSGVIARLTHTPTYDERHPIRHVLAEVGLALAFGWIGWTFATYKELLFLLFYAAIFALIIIIDVEHRWVMLEILIPAGIVAIFEAGVWPGGNLEAALKGGLYGFGVTFGFYLLGLVFGRVMGAIRHRRIGRTVFGLGDVYIGTLGGLIVGSQSLWWAIFLMVFTGGAASLGFIAYKILRTRRYRVFSAIPYGPYIVLGFAAMLYIPQLIDEVVRRFLNWPY